LVYGNGPQLVQVVQVEGRLNGMGRAHKHKAGPAIPEGTKISAALIDFGQALLTRKLQ
jgi:hypothetical protein